MLSLPRVLGVGSGLEVPKWWVRVGVGEFPKPSPSSLLKGLELAAKHHVQACPTLLSLSWHLGILPPWNPISMVPDRVMRAGPGQGDAGLKVRSLVACSSHWQEYEVAALRLAALQLCVALSRLCCRKPLSGLRPTMFGCIATVTVGCS